MHKIVGLSGGYNTHEACRRLTQNNNMSASFSRALSEGLLWGQTMFQFNDQINDNIKKIVAASG